MMPPQQPTSLVVEYVEVKDQPPDRCSILNRSLSPSAIKDGPREVSVNELRNHNKENDCWVEINGHIYDLTSYMHDHPGGDRIIARYAGRDASKVFNRFHEPKVLLAEGGSMCVGKLANESSSTLSGFGAVGAVVTGTIPSKLTQGKSRRVGKELDETVKIVEDPISHTITRSELKAATVEYTLRTHNGNTELHIIDSSPAGLESPVTLLSLGTSPADKGEVSKALEELRSQGPSKIVLSDVTDLDTVRLGIELGFNGILLQDDSILNEAKAESRKVDVDIEIWSSPSKFRSAQLCSGT